MGEFEKRLQEQRAREAQAAVRRQEQEAVRAEEHRNAELLASQRRSRAQKLGHEIVGLLTEHNVPVQRVWSDVWIKRHNLPPVLQEKVRKDDIIERQEMGTGWEVVEHYEHVSDYSGGPTTRYGILTDGRPFTYSYMKGRKYALGKEELGEALIHNPIIEGLIDVRLIDEPHEMLRTLEGSTFVQGILSLIDSGAPAHTMHDSAFPFRNSS